MSLPKSEKIVSSSSPLALIVGDSDITVGLSRRLAENGCEVIELTEFPKSGKFNYIFQFGGVASVKDSYLKHLKPGAIYLFIDYKNEDIGLIKDLSGIKILRIDNLNPWYFQKLIDEILKVAFTSSDKSVTDLRLNKKAEISGPSFNKEIRSKVKKINPLSVSKGIVQKKVSVPLKLVFLLIFVLLLSTASFIYWQERKLAAVSQKFRTDFDSGNFKELKKDMSQMNKVSVSLNKLSAFTRSHPVFARVSLIKESDAVIESFADYLASLNFTVNLMNDFDKSQSPLSSAGFSLSSIKYEEFQNSLTNLSTRTKNLKTALTNLEINFPQKNNLVDNLDKGSTSLDSLLVIMKPFKKLIYAGKKDYLLLFQNNMELRATGGFIGSVGFLGLNNGRQEKLEIMDVYTIDGQIKGHIDPPPEFRKYFEQPNFFLRDSNFDPDFAVSALQAEWFVDKAIQRKVDGVIGVNLFLVQDLLDAVGPVTLSDFNNEVITSDNLFIKAQVFINTNFFAGSQQKKDFLSSLSKEIQKKLAGENISWLKIFRLLSKSLEEKNLLFYFNDPQIQKEFENLDWAGRIFNIRCLNVSEKCLPDYLAIIESNFGVNKANYFVSKAIKVDKKINLNGQVVTDLTLTYNNQSREGLLQGGQYTNYLRLFLPKSISFVNASFDGTNISNSGFDLSSYQNDKVIYGVLLKIPENSSKTFKFTYVLPQNINASEDYYQFYFQKQPGDKVSTLELSFASSKHALVPFNFSPHGTGNSYSFQTEDSVDRIFQFKVTH